MTTNWSEIRRLQPFGKDALRRALDRVFRPDIGREENQFWLQQFAQWAAELHNPALAFPILEGTTYSGLSRTYHFAGYDVPVTTIDNYPSLIHCVTMPKRQNVMHAVDINDAMYDDYLFLKENGIVCNEAGKMLHDIAYSYDDDRKNSYSGSNAYIRADFLGKYYRLSENTLENRSIPLLLEDLTKAVQGDVLFFWKITDTLREVMAVCEKPQVTRYLLGYDLDDEIVKKIIQNRIARQYLAKQKHRYIRQLHLAEKQLHKIDAKEKQNSGEKNIKEYHRDIRRREVLEKIIQKKREQIENCEALVAQAMDDFLENGIVPGKIQTEIEKCTKPCHLETIFAIRHGDNGIEVALTGAHCTQQHNGVIRDPNGIIRWMPLRETGMDPSAPRIVRLYHDDDPQRISVDFGEEFYQTKIQYRHTMVQKSVELHRKLKDPCVLVYEELMPKDLQNTEALCCAAHATWEISQNAKLREAIAQAVSCDLDWSALSWTVFRTGIDPDDEFAYDEFDDVCMKSEPYRAFDACFCPGKRLKKRVLQILGDLFAVFRSMYDEEFRHDTAYVDDIARCTFALLQSPKPVELFAESHLKRLPCPHFSPEGEDWCVQRFLPQWRIM